MSVNVIHVKDGARESRAICAEDGDLTWTTRGSALKLSTCEDCLREILMEKCSICNGQGFFIEYHEEIECAGCDSDAVDRFIQDRGVAKFRIENGG